MTGSGQQEMDWPPYRCLTHPMVKQLDRYRVSVTTQLHEKATTAHSQTHVCLPKMTFTLYKGCGSAETEKALKAADKAFPSWSKLGIEGRSKHILAFRDALTSQKKNIVDVLIQETGKVRGNAEYDFNMLTDCLQFQVEQVRRNNSCLFQSPDDSTLSYTRQIEIL